MPAIQWQAVCTSVVDEVKEGLQSHEGNEIVQLRLPSR